MELNTRGRYAVMAMADLAKQGHVGSVGGSVPLSAIAQRQNISLDYLEQLFLKLRRAGLVESVRGRHGGYKLGRAAGEIFVAEIMTAVEEGTRMTRCFGEQSAGCLGETRCLTHDLWTALGERIESFLASVSLKDVIEGSLRLAPVVSSGVANAGVGSGVGSSGLREPSITTLEGPAQ